MVLRIARHTNRIEQITEFYVGIIGLQIIGEFQNHDGYDGIFLGKKGLNWHLEFTTSNDCDANHFPDDDDLLVFYPESDKEFDHIIANIEAKGIEKLQAKNPYWNANGILIKDPDNYGVILSKQKIG